MMTPAQHIHAAKDAIEVAENALGNTITTDTAAVCASIATAHALTALAELLLLIDESGAFSK